MAEGKSSRQQQLKRKAGDVDYNYADHEGGNHDFDSGHDHDYDRDRDRKKRHRRREEGHVDYEYEDPGVKRHKSHEGHRGEHKHRAVKESKERRGEEDKYQENEISKEGGGKDRKKHRSGKEKGDRDDKRDGSRDEKRDGSRDEKRDGSRDEKRDGSREEKRDEKSGYKVEKGGEMVFDSNRGKGDEEEEERSREKNRSKGERGEKRRRHHHRKDKDKDRERDEKKKRRRREDGDEVVEEERGEKEKKLRHRKDKDTDDEDRAVNHQSTLSLGNDDLEDHKGRGAKSQPMKLLDSKDDREMVSGGNRNADVAAPGEEFRSKGIKRGRDGDEKEREDEDGGNQTQEQLSSKKSVSEKESADVGTGDAAIVTMQGDDSGEGGGGGGGGGEIIDNLLSSALSNGAAALEAETSLMKSVQNGVSKSGLLPAKFDENGGASTNGLEKLQLPNAFTVGDETKSSIISVTSLGDLGIKVSPSSASLPSAATVNAGLTASLPSLASLETKGVSVLASIAPAEPAMGQPTTSAAVAPTLPVSTEAIDGVRVDASIVVDAKFSASSFPGDTASGDTASGATTSNNGSVAATSASITVASIQELKTASPSVRDSATNSGPPLATPSIPSASSSAVEAVPKAAPDTAKRLTLDMSALAKAKEALRRQKELNEKLKKIPQLAKFMKQTAGGPPTAGPGKPLPPSSSSVATTSVLGLPLLPGLGASAGNLTSLVSPLQSGDAGAISGLSGLGAAGVGSGGDITANIVKAQEMAVRLGFQPAPGMITPAMSFVPATTVVVEPPAPTQPKLVKAPVLRLDPFGREIDEKGHVIERQKLTNVSTLKVNINKQKKEAFKILHPELEEDPLDNPFFDPSMGSDKKKLVRARRSTFQFVEEGRWTKQAEIQRLKAQFGEARAREMKAKQLSLAKEKRGNDINPNLIEIGEKMTVKQEKTWDPVPDVEWWDAPLLQNGTYEDVMSGEFNIKAEKITHYVEHPVPIEPPAMAPPPPPQPLKLTKREQKKLRTQRRLAKEKERQEMVRQGLLEPPKPKVKMSNLMKVLGAEATQDPTRLEQEVRSQMLERQQAHDDRNLARKLTPAERREKKERKLFEDHLLETIVSVYRVNDLSNPQTRFKIDINAQENRLTGCAVLSSSFCIVVVEGGAKSIKRYGKLMLRRINWDAALEEKDDDNAPRKENKCVLAWQGSVARASFQKFVIQQSHTEAAARKFLADAGVAHYFDLAANLLED